PRGLRAAARRDQPGGRGDAANHGNPWWLQPPRRGGRTAMAAVVLGTALLLSPAFSGASAGAGSGSATVRAPFQVVDNAGQVIFAVKQAGNGYEADLNDRAGQRAVALISNGQVSGVELFTVGTLDGKFVDTKGFTTVSVGHDQGYAAQRTANTTSAAINLFDAQARVGGLASSLADGTKLELNNATGKPLAELKTIANSGGYLVLGNSTGKTEANGVVAIIIPIGAGTPRFGASARAVVVVADPGHPADREGS
ncbi:MAG: hypothetical protein ACRDGS_02545, partial [Chloroflexota bacterium]